MRNSLLLLAVGPLLAAASTQLVLSRRPLEHKGLARLTTCTAWIVTETGDTCASILDAYAELPSTRALKQVNPGLDCAEPIEEGSVVCVAVKGRKRSSSWNWLESDEPNGPARLRITRRSIFEEEEEWQGLVLAELLD